MLYTTIKDVQNRTFLIDSDTETRLQRERNITYQNTETNRNEQHWLKVLGNRKIDEHTTDNGHNAIAQLYISETCVSPKIRKVFKKKLNLFHNKKYSIQTGNRTQIKGLGNLRSIHLTTGASSSRVYVIICTCVRVITCTREGDMLDTSLTSQP